MKRLAVLLSICLLFVSQPLQAWQSQHPVTPLETSSYGACPACNGDGCNACGAPACGVHCGVSYASIAIGAALIVGLAAFILSQPHPAHMIHLH